MTDRQHRRARETAPLCLSLRLELLLLPAAGDLDAQDVIGNLDQYPLVEIAGSPGVNQYPHNPAGAEDAESLRLQYYFVRRTASLARASRSSANPIT